MKKSTIIILVIVAILAVVVAFFTMRSGQGTLKPELKDFAVQDTASIDRIFMVDKSNQQVSLSRNGSHWVVNDKYVVRQDAIDLLLKTMHRLRVKSPVSKSSLDNVIKMMATRNTKVEIYSKGKHLKTYYVGGPTQDQMGTFMMLEGSSVPFIMSIPGFVGYLSTRYFIDEAQWRSQLLLDYDFDEIARIRSINNSMPEQSLEYTQENRQLTLKRLPDGYQAALMDTLALRYFVSHFERVACEFYTEGLSQEVRDSLEAANPFHVLEVTDIHGKTTRIEAHRRPPVTQVNDADPLPEYDDERLYAWINNETWVTIQYFVFDPLFREFDFFVPSN